MFKIITLPFDEDMEEFDQDRLEREFLFALKDSEIKKYKPELVEKAREVYAALAKANPGRVMWDDNGNIGKRYRRQDEIGTPHCVVIDFQTLEDDTVTVRERDTTEQRRISVTEI